MTEKKQIQIEDCEGNIYYPRTKASAVFSEDGNSIENEINSINNTCVKGCISVYMKDILVLPDGEANMIKFGSSNQTGNVLGFDEAANGILIGAGVKAVLVSAQLYYLNGTASGIKSVHIRKNGNIVNEAFFAHTQAYISCNTSLKLVGVEEGDVLSLSTKGVKGDRVNGGSSSSYLTAIAL